MMHAREKLAWAAVATLGVAVVAAFAGVVQGGPLDPPRPPGATQANLIYQPADCAGFPIKLSQSGSYALAENITMPAGCAKNGVQISADNVTLDMRGFTLKGVTGALTGIETYAWGVTLTNGRVTWWPAGGVRFWGMNHVLSHLVLVANGATVEGGQLSIQDHSRLTDCIVNHGTGAALGIAVWGFGNVVEDCTVSFNRFQGIKVSGTNNRISRNHLAGNDDGGGGCADVWIAGNRNIIEGNTAVTHTNDTCPFYIDGAATGTTIYGNTARGGGVGNYTDWGTDSDIGPISSANAATSSWANISE